MLLSASILNLAFLFFKETMLLHAISAESGVKIRVLADIFKHWYSKIYSVLDYPHAILTTLRHLSFLLWPRFSLSHSHLWEDCNYDKFLCSPLYLGSYIFFSPRHKHILNLPLKTSTFCYVEPWLASDNPNRPIILRKRKRGRRESNWKPQGYIIQEMSVGGRAGGKYEPRQVTTSLCFNVFILISWWIIRWPLKIMWIS